MREIPTSFVWKKCADYIEDRNFKIFKEYFKELYFKDKVSQIERYKICMHYYVRVYKSFHNDIFRLVKYWNQITLKFFLCRRNLKTFYSATKFSWLSEMNTMNWFTIVIYVGVYLTNDQVHNYFDFAKKSCFTFSCWWMRKLNLSYFMFSKPICGLTEANATIMRDCLLRLVPRIICFQSLIIFGNEDTYRSMITDCFVPDLLDVNVSDY